jgi:hypothetical protein
MVLPREFAIDCCWPAIRGLLLLEFVPLDLGLGFFGEGCILELDVVLRQPPKKHRPVLGVRLRVPVQPLETLYLGHEERQSALVERRLTRIANAGQHLKIGGPDADLLVTLLQLLHLGVK